MIKWICQGVGASMIINYLRLEVRINRSELIDSEIEVKETQKYFTTGKGRKVLKLDINKPLFSLKYSNSVTIEIYFFDVEKKQEYITLLKTEARDYFQGIIEGANQAFTQIRNTTTRIK